MRELMAESLEIKLSINKMEDKLTYKQMLYPKTKKEKKE